MRQPLVVADYSQLLARARVPKPLRKPRVIDWAVRNRALSPQECRVEMLVATGMQNKEVAHVMDLSPGTVKVYLHRVMALRGVANRTELTRAYMEREQINAS